MHAYLERVYGSGGAVDVEQLNFFWDNVPGRMGVAVVWQCVTSTGRLYDACGASEAPMFAPLQDASLGLNMLASISADHRCAQRQCLPGRLQKLDTVKLLPLLQRSFDPMHLKFPGFFVHRYREGVSGGHFGDGHFGDGADAPWDRVSAGVPDHRWVEVMRISRLDENGFRKEVCRVGQVWFWLALGSGIWWNTGRSLVLPGPPKRRGWSCWDARREGYDSIQLVDSFGGFTYELLDCRGIDLVDREEPWEAACPPPHIELRSGLPAAADRFAPAIRGEAEQDDAPCVCVGGADHMAC